MPGVDPFLVNSIVFDVNMADLSLIQSDVSGIFTNYSSTVIFSQNDPTSSGANQLILKGSNFANNVANLTAGVIQAVNVNVSIDGCTFSNNAALLKDAGVMLIDCQDTAVSAC